MKKIISFLSIILSICVINKISAYTEYKVGDEVTYSNVDYYVIKDSSSKETSVTMLKAEPLTVEEVNNYGVGHINRYTRSSIGAAYNNNGYGCMAYYTSETCGYVNNSWIYDGCTTNYAQSEIKYVVDAWKNAEAPAASEARLLTYDELIDNLGYDPTISSAGNPQRNDNVPSWVYNSNYWYWTSSQHPSSASRVWYVNYGGSLDYNAVYNVHRDGVVRPVIVLSKIELGDEDESVIEDKEEIDDKENKIDKENDKNDNISKEAKVEKSDNKVSSEVKVANTYMSKSITIIVVGFIVSVLSMVIFYKFVNSKNR